MKPPDMGHLAETKTKTKAGPPPDHPSEQESLAGDPGAAKDDN